MTSQAPDAANPTGLLPHVSPHGRVTAVSMMKDEGPYVLEWVAHHLALGFTDLVVYTNDCSDGTDLMLMRLDALGLVHHRVNAIPAGRRPQPSAIKHAQAEPVVVDSDWVLLFDADEFLVIRQGDGTLDGLITAIKAQGANGIVVTWRIFGSGGIRDWSRDPVTEQYLMAAPADWNKGWGVKTLFQYSAAHWKLGIHRPTMKNKWLKKDFPHGVTWLNGSGKPMEDYFKFRGWRSITRTIGYDWVQMNHYAVKSVDAYALRKFRGNVNLKADKYNADYWALQDRNEVRDEAALRHAPRRAEIMAALLRDPELNRLHHAALARAEAQIAAFRETDAYRDLVAGLEAASAVEIAQVNAKPPRARDPARVAAKLMRGKKLAPDAQDGVAGSSAADAAALYRPGPVDLSVVLDLAWTDNGGIDLPANPRLFTSEALTLIGAGKFERKLRRALPDLLPKDGSVLELGSGCGFLLAHLSRDRPDLTLVGQEDSPGHCDAIRAIWVRAGITTGDRLRLVETPVTEVPVLAALLAEVRPTVLILSAPGLIPKTLARAARKAAVPLPEAMLVTHRLLAAAPKARKEFAELSVTWGLTDSLPLDPTLAIGAVRPA